MENKTEMITESGSVLSVETIRPSLAHSFSEMIDEGTVTRDGKIMNADRLKQYILN